MFFNGTVSEDFLAHSSPPAPVDIGAIMALATIGSHCSLKGKCRKTFALTPPAPADIVALTQLAVNGFDCSFKGQSWKLSYHPSSPTSVDTVKELERHWLPMVLIFCERDSLRRISCSSLSSCISRYRSCNGAGLPMVLIVL
jgi:hypothetical protein